MKASPMMTPGTVAGFDELAGLGGVEPDGLFAEDVLAGVGCADAPGDVQVVRGAGCRRRRFPDRRGVSS